MAVDQKPAITQLGEVVGINKSDPTIDGGLQIIGNGTIGTNHLSSSHLLIGAIFSPSNRCNLLTF